MNLDRFELTTKRLSLQPLTDAHREEVRFVIFAEPDVVRTLMGDASDVEKQRYLVDVWFDDYATTWADSGYGLWGIYRRDDEQEDLPTGLLGLIWLEETDDRIPGTADIGYALTPAAWGKGIGSEAAQKIVDYAFQEIGVPAVDALIFGSINPGSVKLIEKLGAKYLGKKPFEEYGGQEWFETCHNFDMWLLETAETAMLDGRIRGACFRTGQFVAEGYLTKAEAEHEISQRIAGNASLELSEEMMAMVDAAFETGCASYGWSHYRIENPS